MRPLPLLLGLMFLLAGVTTVSPLEGPVEEVLFDPAVQGSWEAPIAWPTKGEQNVLLPTGKILSYESEDLVVLWDPQDGAFTDVSLGGDIIINCAGLAFLPDGRLVVNGGFGDGPMWSGNNATFFFDPFTETWTRGPDMSEARYYPTTMSLPDGRVITMSGNDADGRPAQTVEVLDVNGTAWTTIAGAERDMDMFPRLHVLPDGSLVRVAQEKETLFFDIQTGQWTAGPASAMHRWGTTSVLLPGLDRILVVGGGSMGGSGEGSGPIPLHREDAEDVVHNHLRGVLDGGGPATASAEILDLRGGSSEATWEPTGSMHFPRRDHTAVLLPDGDVMVFNGGAGYEAAPGWVDHTLTPERFDPETGTWTLMAPSERHRGYHSGAQLLPDGRILVTGGDFEWGTDADPAPLTSTAELYSPSYLFRGERPVVTYAPERLQYATPAFIATPDASSVGTVALVRATTVTHSINPDQRLVPLDFEPVPGGLRITAPADGATAPPGWYMLFVLDEDGIPAVAPLVHLR